MRTSIGILAAVCLTFATPAPAQQIRRTGAVSQPNAVLRQIRAKEPDYADPATRRLEILTEVWGNIGLYHPVPSAMHLQWDDVLIEALRSMPQVKSDRELVDLLNRVVFAPLHDPLAYAAIRSTDSPPLAVPPVNGQWLDATTAYVRAADDLGTRPFANRVRAVIDSLATDHVAERLVIDLRSPIRSAYFLAAPWLGMWTPAPIARGFDLSILRSTSNGLGSGTWLVTPWDSLQPLAPTIAVPTVFIVNRTTYPAVERSIDALRAHRSDVAVVLEQTGDVPALWDAEHAQQVWYADSIILSSTRLPILSADGALGSVVDIESPSPIPPSDVAGIAARALAVRATRPARKPFVLAPPRIRDDTISLGPLTREQRLAGLLKTWFWVLHFSPYLDKMHGDWRHALVSLVPQVENARSDSAYYRILQRISAGFDDTHSDIRHPLADGPGRPTRGFTVPLTFGWIEHHLAVFGVDTSQAAVGIAPGDEVLGVNGKSLKEFIADERPNWSLSPPDLDLPPWALMGPRNSTLRLRIRSASGVHEVSLPRSRPFVMANHARVAPHPAYAVLPGNIGFIDLGQVTSPRLLDSAMTALAGTRGMVLDERSAASYDAQQIVFRFITDPMPCMQRIETVSYLGYGPFPIQGVGAAQCWTVPRVSSSAPTYTKPLVVMTSRADISYGESLAQYMRLSGRATLVGEPTNGTFGLVAAGITLPGGATVRLSYDRELWPDGAEYHGIGVIPDVPVHPTFLGLRRGQDEVYETALATLKRLLNQ